MDVLNPNLFCQRCLTPSGTSIQQIVSITLSIVCLPIYVTMLPFLHAWQPEVWGPWDAERGSSISSISATSGTATALLYLVMYAPHHLSFSPVIACSLRSPTVRRVYALSLQLTWLGIVVTCVFPVTPNTIASGVHVVGVSLFVGGMAVVSIISLAYHTTIARHTLQVLFIKMLFVLALIGAVAMIVAVVIASSPAWLFYVGEAVALCMLAQFTFWSELFEPRHEVSVTPRPTARAVTVDVARM